MRGKLTDQQQRELALDLAYKRTTTVLGLQNGLEVATYLGWTKSSFYGYKAKKFQTLGFGKMCWMARKLGFTEEEWCAICGLKDKGGEQHAPK